MHTYPINENLLAVARAGAGVNNIPIPELTDKGIVVFNTPGANANGVKELVICGMLMAVRNLKEATEWADSLDGKEDVAALVEKGKSAFVGSELNGKTLGVIGLGAIGAKVANSAAALGMNIMGYDPYLSSDNKCLLTCEVNFVNDVNTIYRNADIITIHVPLLDSTKDMINKLSLSFMKKGVVIVNMSRAELVNNADMLLALEEGRVHKYVVDFPTCETVNKKGVIAIPHLGASTEESEDNCAIMAASQIKDYLENGIIVNSVNFPKMTTKRVTSVRIAVTYNTGTKALDTIKKIATNAMFSYAERGSIGYALIDVENCDDVDIETLSETDDILMIRIM
jgi:D-3-phosphoglycerate dehydrogenase